MKPRSSRRRPGRLGGERLRVRYAADGRQQLRALDPPLAVRGADGERQAAVGPLHPERRGRGQHRDPVIAQDRGDLVGDVLVFHHHQPGGAFDDRDLAAEPAEHLAELQPDVAAAKDDQVLGDLVELHDRGRVEHRDVARAVDRQRPGPGARVDDDHRRADRPGAAVGEGDLERLRPGEVGLALDQVKPLLRETAGVVLPRAADHRPLALAHRRQVDRDRAGPHPVLGAAARQVGEARAGDHGLGRGAPGVDADPAERAALDQRHLLPCLGQLDRKEPAALAGPDHDRVVVLVLHRLLPAPTSLSHEVPSPRGRPAPPYRKR